MQESLHTAPESLHRKTRKTKETQGKVSLRIPESKEKQGKQRKTEENLEKVSLRSPENKEK